jgi:hypothetical protein
MMLTSTLGKGVLGLAAAAAVTMGGAQTAQADSDVRLRLGTGSCGSSITIVISDGEHYRPAHTHYRHGRAHRTRGVAHGTCGHRCDTGCGHHVKPKPRCGVSRCDTWRSDRHWRGSRHWRSHDRRHSRSTCRPIARRCR